MFVYSLYTLGFTRQKGKLNFMCTKRYFLYNVFLQNFKGMIILNLKNLSGDLSNIVDHDHKPVNLLHPSANSLSERYVQTV